MSGLSGSHPERTLQILRIQVAQTSNRCFLFPMKHYFLFESFFTVPNFGKCLPRENWAECGGQCVGFLCVEDHSLVQSVAQFLGKKCFVFFILFGTAYKRRICLKPYTIMVSTQDLNYSKKKKPSNTITINFYYKHALSLAQINKVTIL